MKRMIFVLVLCGFGVILFVLIKLIVVFYKHSQLDDHLMRDRANMEQRVRLTVLTAYIDEYVKNYGVYPNSLADISEFLDRGKGLKIEEYCCDAWGSKLVYEYPFAYSTSFAFNVYSIGANKQDNGGLGDDIAAPAIQDILRARY